MIPLVLALAAMLTGGTDIVLLDGRKTTRIRVVVDSADQSREANWSAFLDRFLDHFDRDGDGSLSQVEAARVFPLPLPGGHEAKMDFARLDADGDGQATRTEFQAFYRAAGFSPVVVVLRSPTAELQQVSDALFRNLDRDGDGILTHAELEKSPTLLRRLDENEDEILTPAELLGLESPSKNPSPTAILQAAPRAGPADAILFLSRAENGGVPKAVGQFGALSITTIAPAEHSGLQTAKGFYLAQFSAAVGNRPSLEKAELESDPSLQAVAAMFEAADRDGDGKLSAAELRAFLDLVELGVKCQVVVAIEDRGGNLFDILDANRDGVLDLAELHRAARSCAGATRLPVKRGEVPRRLQISGSRVPVGPAFGPVPVPAAPAPKAAARVKIAQGPEWFQALDRNRDGFVSMAEFIGPPELFRKLDTNGDGQISVTEASLIARE